MTAYVLLLVALVIGERTAWAMLCSRYPRVGSYEKSPVDDNYAILISGNPLTYSVGQEYNISVNAYNGLKFVSLLLALENENGQSNPNDDLGRFEIIDPIDTRFSPNCINMVESTNTNPKARLDFTWVAPENPNTGCVLIRATLFQHRDIWFMDDGGLTRRICPEVTDDVGNRASTVAMQPCCACDEARYELTFERVWSRNLHPKDFPEKGWETRFSDIIGATHTDDFRFWEYGEMATTAMQEFAEHGSSRSIERQMNVNFKNGKIRTIIKARGPTFPSVNSPSVASVRVDPTHHLISMASKVDPSPDWVVGVAGLELCLPNCTWMDERKINLYPWDIGTDAGPSYISPDQPQMPPDVIRRIYSDMPNDPRSPFYDETGASMMPLATIHIRKHRLYERMCEDPDSNNLDLPKECFTHPWTPWTECTVKCGRGTQYRTRVFKNPDLANYYSCVSQYNISMREEQRCMGENCKDTQQVLEMSNGNEAAIDESFGGNNDNGVPTNWNPRENYRNNKDNVNTVDAEEGAQSWNARRKNQNRYAYKDNQAKTGGVDVSNDRFAYKGNEEITPGFEANNNRYPNNLWNSNGRGNLDERGDEETPWNSRGGIGNNLYKPGSNNDGGPNNVWNSNGGDNRDGRGEEDTPWNSRGGSGNNRNRPGVGSVYSNRDDNIWNAGSENNQNGGRWDGRNNNYQPPLKLNAGTSDYENGNTYEDPGYGNGLEVGNLRRGNEAYEPDQRRNGRAYTGNRNPQTTGTTFSRQIHNNRQESANDRTAPECKVLSLCFEPLQIYPCGDTSVTANYWFYNYCLDKCMLFATDRCDRNVNKFRSLEQCESTCRAPDNLPYLQSKQEQDCYRNGMTSRFRRSP